MFSGKCFRCHLTNPNLWRWESQTNYFLLSTTRITRVCCLATTCSSYAWLRGEWDVFTRSWMKTWENRTRTFIKVLNDYVLLASNFWCDVLRTSMMALMAKHNFLIARFCWHSVRASFRSFEIKTAKLFSADWQELLWTLRTKSLRNHSATAIKSLMGEF